MGKGNLTGHHHAQPKITCRLEDLYGDSEVQVSEGGEADLHKHLSGCIKNPGHSNFIPAETFRLKHLPEGHQDQDLLDLIKAASDLTVRVDVNLTSPDRYRYWPDTDVPYPFYGMRGKEIMRIGSGRVTKVSFLNEDFIDCRSNSVKKTSSCPCGKCLLSDDPKNVWWEVVVQTAMHVVFDSHEASHTTLRLFYDRQDSPPVKLDEISICDVYVKRDQCFLSCATCDIKLGDKIYRVINKLDILWKKVYEKYKKFRDESKLTFIASHPHGCPKHISIGKWVDRFCVDGFVNKFTYTTSTCPGCSGAYVNILGYNTSSYQPVHSGSLNRGLNYSGAGIVIDYNCS